MFCGSNYAPSFLFFAARMSHLENVLMAFQNVQSKLINGEAGIRWVRNVYNDGIFNLNKTKYLNYGSQYNSLSFGTAFKTFKQ